jgi:hypothetical protein
LPFWVNDDRSDPLDETHFHLILAARDLQGIYPIRQVVETIPVQLLLIIFNFSLERAAYETRIIFENGLQKAFLWVIDLESKMVDEHRGFNF